MHLKKRKSVLALSITILLMLIIIRACILVCVVIVVVVGVVFFGERSLSVTEVECLGVNFELVGGGIFDLWRWWWKWKWRI